MHSARIEIECLKGSLEAVYKSILPDITSSERADISINKKESSLEVLINSRDISALRASMNTILKLAKVAIDCSEV